MKVNKKFLALCFFIFFGTLCLLKCDTAEARTGYIYTGDSRIRRLNLTIGMSKQADTWVYCKSGKGYSWFVDESLEDINETIENNTHIDNWIIISGWGVNDLWNIDTYLEKYQELLKGKWKNCNLFLMSVNPVDGVMTAKYSAISLFNDKLYRFVSKNNVKTGGRVFYIDSNSVMGKKGFSTIDGLHYTEKTNKLIYRTIRLNINQTGKDGTIPINVNAKRTLVHLGVNKKVQWKSSNPGVIKVVKKYDKNKCKADVVAKSPGTAVVTATSEDYQIDYVITVSSDDYPLTVYFTYDGNTEAAAEFIQGHVGGDVVCIYSDPFYPLKKEELNKRIKREIKKDSRPDILLNVRQSISEKLLPNVDADSFDLSKYSKVYMGYPLWNEQAPKAIYSFLEKYDISQKDINIFYISYDDTAYECELKDVYPKLNISSVIGIQGDNILNKSIKKQLKDWIK